MNLGFDAKRIFHNSTGLGNYGRDLIRILTKHFPDNNYFLYNPKAPTINRIKEAENLHIRQPEGAWKFLSSYWRTGPMRKEIHNDRIQLYHGLSAELPHNPGVSTVVTIHDLIFLTHPELYRAIDRKIYFEKSKRAISSSNHIVSISEQTKTDISRFFQTDPEKITVIHQGCHPQFKEKKPVDDLEKIKQKYRLPESYILNVGTLEERKNALLILKAVKDIDQHVVLVGRKTPYVDILKEYISKNDMGKRVHMIHDVGFSELPGIYQMARLFCYPSHYEGFGIPILEALHSDIPVITSATGCFEEAGGKAASYINPNDPEGLATTIRQILSDESYQISRQSIIANHLKLFEDSAIAENYMEVYQKVINHG